MRYQKVQFDVSNGEGCGYSLYVQGCRNHCPGCFNPETWDFGGGELFTDAVADDISRKLQNKSIKRLTILGGEPFEPETQPDLVEFLRFIKKNHPEKVIWCYTGFTYDEIKSENSRCRTKHTDKLLDLLDVLVDGRFVMDLHDYTLPFRGSSNQNIIRL